MTHSPLDYSKIPITNDLMNFYPDYTNIAQWIWIMDWYDGPIKGMIKVNNKKYIGLCVDENVIKRLRIFALFNIGKKRIKYEEYWQELHKICIGPDIDNWHNGQGINKYTRKFYYGRYQANHIDISLTDYPIIGWFTY